MTSQILTRFADEPMVNVAPMAIPPAVVSRTEARFAS